MELFFGSFIIFLTVALALGIGVVFRGRPLRAGCRRLPGSSDCKLKALCGGVCRSQP